MSTVKAVSPLTLDRYELKYLIPYEMVAPISKYVEQFCEMDYYSQISPNHAYVINSLYLDTPSLQLLNRKENGDPGYFSLRIRSYGTNPKLPLFFESKQKYRDFSRKRRAKVYVENFGDLIESPESVADYKQLMQEKNFADFMNKVNLYGARPVIFTQYSRIAYLSTLDDYARVTFDMDLKYMEERNFNAVPNESIMSHYDHCDSFQYPGSGYNVILELKCERKIPIWIVQLVKHFGLTQRNFSKFGNSMLECYGRAVEDFAFDRYSPVHHRTI
ncbi:MAG: polyphosphate polymerase domain-containing protein [Oligoflexia bacterium]|nr:polyphosphate polymerase domain-containing protein [Oligoflexia bacterium]